MKVIYNKFIPFKGYKAMNLFGIVFVRKGAKFDTYDYNHEHIHLKQMQEMLWIFYYLWYAIEYLIIMFFAKWDKQSERYHDVSFEESVCIEAGRIAIPSPFSAMVIAVRASPQVKYISHISPARSKAASIYLR